jgi:hypothetical protein
VIALRAQRRIVVRALIRLVVPLVVVVAIVASAAAWLGVVQVPVVSSLAGMDKAPSLGAQAADPAAYATFVKANGITFSSPGANYTFASKHTFSGSFAFKGTMPEGTILAIHEFGAVALGIRDVTILHDGSADAAAFMDLAPYGYPVADPVKTTFHVAVTSPRSVKVTIDALTFGRVGVPADIAAKAQDAVNTYLATRLATIDGLRIDALSFVNGGVSFAGTLPQAYGAATPKAGDLP